MDHVDLIAEHVAGHVAVCVDTRHAGQSQGPGYEGRHLTTGDLVLRTELVVETASVGDAGFVELVDVRLVDRVIVVPEHAAPRRWHVSPLFRLEEIGVGVDAAPVLPDLEVEVGTGPLGVT